MISYGKLLGQKWSNCTPIQNRSVLTQKNQSVHCTWMVILAWKNTESYFTFWNVPDHSHHFTIREALSVFIIDHRTALSHYSVSLLLATGVSFIPIKCACPRFQCVYVHSIWLLSVLDRSRRKQSRFSEDADRLKLVPENPSICGQGIASRHFRYWWAAEQYASFWGLIWYPDKLCLVVCLNWLFVG